ncbi:MAG TPA: STAS domain-containing protein [Methylomirabilota bacterium]|jgi:anti-sigma B factor antagonist|nr:STAS domain-containing protein [Methylomirabilota bacterium]
MQVMSRQIGSVTIMAVEGELTVPTAGAFLRRSRLMLAPVAAPLVAVDLGGVRRLDSSGFSALVALLRDVQRRGGEVCLVNLGPEARLLLEIMQLHLLFDVHDDLASAAEALTAAREASPAPTASRRLLGRIRTRSVPLAERRAVG